jgi:hypothetical protein
MRYNSELKSLIRFAERWASLGEGVTEQVKRVVNDPFTAADQARARFAADPLAMGLAKSRLGGLNEELDRAFARYFALLDKARR